MFNCAGTPGRDGGSRGAGEFHNGGCRQRLAELPSDGGRSMGFELEGSRLMITMVSEEWGVVFTAYVVPPFNLSFLGYDEDYFVEGSGQRGEDDGFRVRCKFVYPQRERAE